MSTAPSLAAELLSPSFIANAMRPIANLPVEALLSLESYKDIFSKPFVRIACSWQKVTRILDRRGKSLISDEQRKIKNFVQRYKSWFTLSDEFVVSNRGYFSFERDLKAISDVFEELNNGSVDDPITVRTNNMAAFLGVMKWKQNLRDIELCFQREEMTYAQWFDLFQPSLEDVYEMVK